MSYKVAGYSTHCHIEQKIFPRGPEIPTEKTLALAPLFILSGNQCIQHIVTDRIEQVYFYSSWVELITKNDKQITDLNGQTFPTSEHLVAYLKNVYFLITQTGTKYTLTARVRGLGGGNTNSSTAQNKNKKTQSPHKQSQEQTHEQIQQVQQETIQQPSQEEILQQKLQKAIDNNSPKEVELLLFSGANVNGIRESVDFGLEDVSNFAISPLGYAIYTKKREIAKILINAGARFMHSNFLILTAKSDESEILALMLSKYSFGLRYLNEAFSSAVSVSSLTCMDVLLRAGASMDKSTFLWLIEKQKTDVVSFMLEKGFDPNFSDEKGMTPLIALIRYAPRNPNFEKLLKLMIEKKADVNLPQKNITPLHSAFEYRLVAAIRILLQNKANPNIGNLCHIIWNPDWYHEEIYQLLVDGGLNLNLTDPDTQLTVLGRLCKENKWNEKSIRILTFFLTHSASPKKIPDEIYANLPSNIKTLIQEKSATEKDYIEIAQFLVSKIRRNMPEELEENLEKAQKIQEFENLMTQLFTKAQILPLFYDERNEQVLLLRKKFSDLISGEVNKLLNKKSFLDPERRFLNVDELHSSLDLTIKEWKADYNQNILQKLEQQNELRIQRSIQSSMTSKLEELQNEFQESKKESQWKEQQLMEELQKEKRRKELADEKFRQQQQASLNQMNSTLSTINRNVQWSAYHF